MQLRKDTSQEKRSPDMSHSKHSFDHFVRCVAILVLAVGAGSVDARGQSVPAPVKISNGVLPGKSFAAMAVDAKGGIDIAWTQSDGSVTFRRSTDGGVTFSNPTVVQPAISPTPILVAIQVGADEAGDINLVWTEFGVGPDADLFSRSTDGGLTFPRRRI
jgi:hypothetical protein